MTECRAAGVEAASMRHGMVAGRHCRPAESRNHAVNLTKKDTYMLHLNAFHSFVNNQFTNKESLEILWDIHKILYTSACLVL